MPGVDQVLGAVGNTVQRPPVIVGGNLPFRRPRLPERLIGADGDERVQFGIERLNALQGGPGEFQWRELPPLDQRGDLGDGLAVQQGFARYAGTIGRSRAS